MESGSQRYAQKGGSPVVNPNKRAYGRPMTACTKCGRDDDRPLFPASVTPGRNHVQEQAEGVFCSFACYMTWADQKEKEAERDD